MKRAARRAAKKRDDQLASSGVNLLGEYLRLRSQPAFRRLAEFYSPLIYSNCLRVLHDRQLAEDAAQSVLLLLVTKAESIDPEHLAGWITKTARFVSRGMGAKRAAQVSLQRRLHPSLAVPRDGADGAAEAMTAIAQALSQMRADSRNLIQRHYLEGAGTGELAAQLGLSVPALRKRLSRAVADLRQAAKRAIAQAGG